MLARLLNALLHRFRRPRVDEPPQGGPPAHWLKLRDQGPPPHWLEVARRAGSPTGTSTDPDQHPTPPPASPDEATTGEQGRLAEKRPISEPSAPSRTRSQIDAPHGEFQKIRASDEPTFAAETKSPALPLAWPPKREGHDSDRTVNFSERSKGTGQSEPANQTRLAPTPVQISPTPSQPDSQMPQVSTTEPRGNFIVHFLRRFKKVNQPVPQIQRVQAPGPDQPETLQKRNEGDSALPRPMTVNTAWPLVSDNSRLAPIIFPESSRRSPRPPFRNAPSSPAAFSENSVSAGQEADIVVSKRSVSRVEVLTSPTPVGDTDSRRKHEARQESIPLRWATLPSLGHETATRFAAQRVSQDRERTTFGGSEPNWWPELIPDDPTFKETNWRSLMRQIQRSQRLEKEQRGY